MSYRIVIILLLFSISCTVTKRVHRKGVNIEWHKTYSNHKKSFVFKVNKPKNKELFESKRTLIEAHNSSDSITLNYDSNLISITNIENENQIDTAKSINVKKKYKERLKKKQLYNTVLSEPSTNNYLAVRNKIFSNDNILKYIGISILVLGLLLVITSLIMIAGFSGFVNIFNSLVLSSSGIVASFFGLLLFLILIISFFIFAFFIEAIGGITVGIILGLILTAIGGLLLLIDFFLK